MIKNSNSNLNYFFKKEHPKPHEQQYSSKKKVQVKSSRENRYQRPKRGGRRS